MLLALRRASLLLLLCLVSVAWSQETQTPSVPACAAKCLVGGFSTGLCAPADKMCICTNEQFQANVAACIAVSCTIPESLAAKNVSATNCGSPVRAHGEDYVLLSNIMVAFAAAFVAMRFAFKIVVAQLDIGMDDWSVLACLVAATPSAVITVFGTVENGLGRDMWTLTPIQITKMLKYFYIMASLYFTQVALLKLTLIFFYIRVFPSKGVQRLLWGTVFFVIFWGFSYVVVAVLQCRPIHYFWTKWDGLHKGTCLNIDAITASNAGLSIALDLWILGIPLWQLYGLKLHWKKKVGVALMFCVGTFVTIVSILRLRALVHFSASKNASWEFYNVSVWSTIEICVGIMCACLPTLRLLLVRLFPVLGGSSARSRANDKYYNYGSGNELRSVGQSHRSRNVQSTISSVSHTARPQVCKQDDVIMVKTSYTIQRTQIETDEMSLVSHESVKAKS